MINYKIISIEKELELSQSLPNPYFVEQENMLFIGLNHTRNPEHSQFEIIFEKIKTFNPSLVLVEIPDNLIGTLINSELDERISKFGEIGIIYPKLPLYTRLVGWDIEKDKLKQSLENDFNKDLIESLDILHRVQAKVSRFKEKPIVFLNEELKNKNNIKEIIELHFKERLGKSINELTTQDKIAPSPLENSIFLEGIRKESELRELNLINLILSFKDKVLVLAGRNHVIRIIEFMNKNK